MVPNIDAVIYIAGHTGMVGSAIVRRLQTLGYANILTQIHAEFDLLDQKAVQDFFAKKTLIRLSGCSQSGWDTCQ